LPPPAQAGKLAAEGDLPAAPSRHTEGRRRRGTTNCDEKAHRQWTISGEKSGKQGGARDRSGATTTGERRHVTSLSTLEAATLPPPRVHEVAGRSTTSLEHHDTVFPNLRHCRLPQPRGEAPTRWRSARHAPIAVPARPRVLRVDGAPVPPSPPTSAVGISAPRGPSSWRASHAPSAGGQGTAPSSEGGAGARRATARVRRVGGGARSGNPVRRRTGGLLRLLRQWMDRRLEVPVASRGLVRLDLLLV
jgi:hypothetical protein